MSTEKPQPRATKPTDDLDLDAETVKDLEPNDRAVGAVVGGKSGSTGGSLVAGVSTRTTI